MYTPKYGPKIRESKKNHLRDEIIERELKEDLQRLDDDYDFQRELGLSSKE